MIVAAQVVGAQAVAHKSCVSEGQAVGQGVGDGGHLLRGAGTGESQGAVRAAHT